MGFSRSDWTVRAAGGRVTVESGAPRFAGPRPSFLLDLPDEPRWGRSPVAADEVPGGWLVG